MNLLEKTKLRLLEKFAVEIKKPSSNDFEFLVFEEMCEAAIYTPFEGTIRKATPHEFPDILVNDFFGVEVKMTTGDQWKSTGNSVLESSRTSFVEKIFIFFGKFGGKIDFKFRTYEECLYEIAVTHSPRYKIDMNLEEGNSIFKKMGIPYNELRMKENMIPEIKNYYRAQLKPGEEFWWMDAETSNSSPIIRSFKSLSHKDQNQFRCEAFVLFPEIFSQSQNKFTRIAAYLLTSWNTVSASLRDIFTAGGTEIIQIDGFKRKVSRIEYNLSHNAKVISSILKTMDKNILEFYWRMDSLDGRNVETEWLKRIDKESKSQIKPSKIYLAGVNQSI